MKKVLATLGVIAVCSIAYAAWAQFRYESVVDYISEQVAPDRTLTWAVVIRDMGRHVDTLPITDTQKLNGLLTFNDAVTSGIGVPKRIKAYLSAGEITNAKVVWQTYIDGWVAYNATQDALSSATFSGEWD